MTIEWSSRLVTHSSPGTPGLNSRSEGKFRPSSGDEMISTLTLPMSCVPSLSTGMPVTTTPPLDSSAPDSPELASPDSALSAVVPLLPDALSSVPPSLADADAESDSVPPPSAAAPPPSSPHPSANIGRNTRDRVLERMKRSIGGGVGRQIHSAPQTARLPRPSKPAQSASGVYCGKQNEGFLKAPAGRSERSLGGRREGRRPPGR